MESTGVPQTLLSFPSNPYSSQLWYSHHTRRLRTAHGTSEFPSLGLCFGTRSSMKFAFWKILRVQEVFLLVEYWEAIIRRGLWGYKYTGGLGRFSKKFTPC